MANEVKATKRPSALRLGSSLLPFRLGAAAGDTDAAGGNSAGLIEHSIAVRVPVVHEDIAARDSR